MKKLLLLILILIPFVWADAAFNRAAIKKKIDFTLKDTDSLQFTGAVINEAINTGILKAHTELPGYIDSFRIVTVANTWLYALPTDFEFPLAVLHLNTAASSIVLNYVNLKDLGRNSSGTELAEYSFFDTTLVVMQRPSKAGDTLILFYLAVPDTLTSSSYLELPDRWVMAVVYFALEALWDGASRPDRAAIFEAKGKAEIKSIEAVLQKVPDIFIRPKEVEVP